MSETKIPRLLITKSADRYNLHEEVFSEDFNEDDLSTWKGIIIYAHYLNEVLNYAIVNCAKTHKIIIDVVHERKI